MSSKNLFQILPKDAQATRLKVSGKPFHMKTEF